MDKNLEPMTEEQGARFYLRTLRQQIVDAFKAGELSAVSYNSMLIALQPVEYYFDEVKKVKL